MSCTPIAVGAALPVAAGGAAQVQPVAVMPVAVATTTPVAAMPAMSTTQATAGAQGGATTATMGGGGQAIAGAASAVGSDQLVPVLNQLSSTLTALAGQMTAGTQAGAAPLPTAAPAAAPTAPPVTGGGAAAPAVASGGCGCGCGGGTMVGANAAPQAYRSGGRSRSKGHAKQAQRASNTTKMDPSQIKRYVSGDIDGLNPELLEKLAIIGKKTGEKVNINSGFRSRAEQEKLYAAYQNGTGNLAAKPGTSNHESGDAADVTLGGTNLADTTKGAKLAKKLGLGFPVPGEPWHVEVM